MLVHCHQSKQIEEEEMRKNLGILSALQQSDLVNSGEAVRASVSPRRKKRGGKGHANIRDFMSSLTLLNLLNTSVKRVFAVLPFSQLSL